MKLSEAIMLGSVTCKMEAGNWNSCALGAAANAVGIPQVEGFLGVRRIQPIFEAWPWINDGGSPILTIADKFDNHVCKGEMTLEQLVDFVRLIEPSCGDCNRFECSCVQKMDEFTDAGTLCLTN